MKTRYYFDDFEGCGVKAENSGFTIKWPDREPYEVANDSKLAHNIIRFGKEITEKEYLQI